MIYKLMQFKLLIPVIQLKKLTIKQTFLELKRKYLIIMMIKNITTQEFNNQMADNIAARLANLATKADLIN